MKAKRKKELLKFYANNLRNFYPDYKNHFMCPTCLKLIPLEKMDQITKAHIIPRKAKGKMSVFICHTCNSEFGRKQDFWFGDFINIANSPSGTEFETDIKKKSFSVDGIKYNGMWKFDKNGNLNFIVHVDRHPPGILKKIEDQFSTAIHTHKISVEIPIHEKGHLISIGLLTAGYLMWFYHLGYSWALQSHLDLIRNQIRNPEKTLYNFKSCKANQLNSEPWIGYITIKKETFLGFGIKNLFVLYPSFYNPDAYNSALPKNFQIPPENIKKIDSPKPIIKLPATRVVYEDQLVISPDMVSFPKNNSIVLLILKNGEMHILRPVSEAEAKNLEFKNSVIKRSIKVKKD